MGNQEQPWQRPDRPRGNDEDGEEIDEVQAEISQVRQIIQEYQEEREAVRLLEDHTHEDS